MITVTSTKQNSSSQYGAYLKFGSLDFVRSDETNGIFSVTVKMLNVKMSYKVAADNKAEMDVIEKFSLALSRAFK